MEDTDLLDALAEMKPAGRWILRKYLIADETDREALMLALYKDGTGTARDLADLIDVLNDDPDQRRRVTGSLESGKLEARPCRDAAAGSWTLRWTPHAPPSGHRSCGHD